MSSPQRTRILGCFVAMVCSFLDVISCAEVVGLGRSRFIENLLAQNRGDESEGANDGHQDGDSAGQRSGHTRPRSAQTAEFAPVLKSGTGQNNESGGDEKNGKAAGSNDALRDWVVAFEIVKELIDTEAKADHGRRGPDPRHHGA